MAQDFEASPLQIKRVAQKALEIEQYLLRRAWGFCYAVVAVEIALTIFLPVLFRALALSTGNPLAFDVGVNTAGSLTGLAVAAWILKRAYKAALVRREIADSKWTRLFRSPVLLALMWAAYYLPIAAAIFFLRPHALTVEFGLLVMSALPSYFVLRVSFPEKLPRESVAVLTTFVVCGLGSFAVSIFDARPVFYVAFWVAMIVVCLWASLHARTQKSPAPLEDPANW